MRKLKKEMRSVFILCAVLYQCTLCPVYKSVDFIPIKNVDINELIRLDIAFLPQEILKLRKKITSTVQVLTHLKEKLQFVQAENQVQKGRLREVEAEAAMVKIVCLIVMNTCNSL